MTPQIVQKKLQVRLPTEVHSLGRALIISQESFLVCRAQGGYVYLLGGHVEPGESIPQALFRELQEETGISFKLEAFLGVIEHRFEAPPSRCHAHEYNFIFQASAPGLTEGYSFPKRESGILLEWLSWEQLSKEDLRPVFLKTIIPQWIQQKTKHGFFCIGFDENVLEYSWLPENRHS